MVRRSHRVRAPRPGQVTLLCSHASLLACSVPRSRQRTSASSNSIKPKDIADSGKDSIHKIGTNAYLRSTKIPITLGIDWSHERKQTFSMLPFPTLEGGQIILLKVFQKSPFSRLFHIIISGTPNKTRMDPTMMSNETMDLPTVAEYLGAKTETISQLARRGELPGAQIGKGWIFLREDVLAFLRTRIAAETEARRTAKQGEEVQMPERGIQAVAVGQTRSRRRVPPLLPELRAYDYQS